MKAILTITIENYRQGWRARYKVVRTLKEIEFLTTFLKGVEFTLHGVNGKHGHCKVEGGISDNEIEVETDQNIVKAFQLLYPKGYNETMHNIVQDLEDEGIFQRAGRSEEDITKFYEIY